MTAPPQMDPISLRFRVPGLEAAYMQYYTGSIVWQMRGALLLGGTLYGLFGVLDLWIAPALVVQFWFIRALVVGWVGIVIALTFAPIRPAMLQVLVTSVALVAGLGLGLMMVLGDRVVSDLYYVGLIIILIFSCTILGLRFVYSLTTCLVMLSIYAASEIAMLGTLFYVVLNNSYFLVSAVLAGLYASFTIENYTRRNYLQARTILDDRREIERLLTSILPAPIAQRLKANPEKIADYFPEATVLFADIVEFTPYAATIPPAELVDFLNEVFSMFDRITDDVGMEKIKTIGDAYMAIAGLPVPYADHTERAARAALRMQEAVADYNRAHSHAVQIRIGLDAGPVVAGVIGSRKFIYDLWGDTVNTASRMESHGLPGQIQVTEAVYRKLKDRYAFCPRGEVEIKGKGQLTTYLLMHNGTGPGSA